MTPYEQGLTVTIVTFNSADVLGGCLDTLREALRGVPNARVVVADNASSDDTVRIAATHPIAARVVPLPENLGYAGGINAGLRAVRAAGPILVLNPDVRLAPDAVERLLVELGQPGVGICVPKLLDEHGSTSPSLRRDPTVGRALGEAVLGGIRAGRHERWGEVVRVPSAYLESRTADWATGAVMLISRECAAAVGAWDESFFLYSEETDFALRARDAGFSLRYEPDAVVVHRGGESNSSPRLSAILAVNRIRLFRRRHSLTRTAAFAAAVVLNSMLRVTAPTHRAVLAALLLPWRHPAELRGASRKASSQPDGPDYLCFSIQDYWYHNRGHSDFQLMRRVAETRRVLFVNSIGMRMPLPGRSTMFLRRVLRKAHSVTKFLRRPIPALPNFHVITPLIIPAYGSERLRALNARLVAAQVNLVARWLRMRDPVCFLTIPTAWEVIQRVPHRTLVYNRSDKHSAFEEADQAYIRDLEQALLANSDSVLYVSRQLMADEADVVGERAVFLDHGVELDHFDPSTAGDEPEELAAIPHPRIGYFGGLDDYLVDFTLLEQVARSLPDAQLVLIGDATWHMGALRALPNVHWLGYRPYAEIPRYGAGFDVAIMPWQDNDWIRSANPIKLKEYLALGLPIVSTDFPEIRYYTEWVRVAGDRDEFVELVEKTLADGGRAIPAARRSAVASSDWRCRTEQLLAICEGEAHQSMAGAPATIAPVVALLGPERPRSAMAAPDEETPASS